MIETLITIAVSAAAGAACGYLVARHTWRDRLQSMKRKELDIRRRRLELHREQFQASTSRIHRPTEVRNEGNQEHLEDLEQLRLEMLLMKEDHQLEKQMLEEENARLKKGPVDDFAPVEPSVTTEAVIIEDEDISEVGEDAISEVEEDAIGNVVDDAPAFEETAEKELTEQDSIVKDADIDAVFASPLVSLPKVTATSTDELVEDQTMREEDEEAVETAEAAETAEIAGPEELAETAEVVETQESAESEELAEMEEPVESVEAVQSSDFTQAAETVEHVEAVEEAEIVEVEETVEAAETFEPGESAESLATLEQDISPIPAPSGTVFSVPSDIESLFDHPIDLKEAQADSPIEESTPKSEHAEGNAGLPESSTVDSESESLNKESEQLIPDASLPLPTKKRTRSTSRSEGKDASFSFHWQSDRPGFHPDPKRATTSSPATEESSGLNMLGAEERTDEENPASAPTTHGKSDEHVKPEELADAELQQAQLKEQSDLEHVNVTDDDGIDDSGHEAPIPVFRSLHDMLTASGVGLPATDRPKLEQKKERDSAASLSEIQTSPDSTSDSEAAGRSEETSDSEDVQNEPQRKRESEAKGEESLVRSIVGLDPDSFSLLQELGYADLARLSGLSNSEIRRLAEVFRIRPERIEQDWKPTARAHMNLLAASRS